MNGEEISEILLSNPYTKNYFLGVHSIDNLHTIREKPTIVVCNTDPAHLPGRHWVLFYFNSRNEVEFVDSIGKEPSYYGSEFITFMGRFSDTCVFNINRIQPDNSIICGHFCVLYAILRCKLYGNMYKTLQHLILNINHIYITVERMLLHNGVKGFAGTCKQHCIKN